MGDSKDQLKTKAEALERASNYHSAGEHFMSWAEQSTSAEEKEEGFFRAASCFEKAHEYEKAIHAYTAVVDLHMEWEAGALLNRGNIHKNQGNLEQALEDYNACGEAGLNIGNKRHAAMGFHNYGQPLYNSGKVDEARQAWEKSYKADKTYIPTIMDLAEVYLVSAMTSKSLNLIRTGLKCSLNSAQKTILLMLQCLALFFDPKGSDSKKIEEAERQLKSAAGDMREKPQFAVKYIKKYLQVDKDQQQFIKKITSYIK